MNNMRKILLTMSLLISSLFCYTQTKEQFPRYYIKNGDTLGVIISLDQARNIDNDYELLDLLSKYKYSAEKLDSSYAIVINSMKSQIEVLNLKTNEFEGIIKIKDAQILNLQSQIEKYIRDNELANSQIRLKDDIIENYKKEKRSSFFKTVTLVVAVGILFLLK